MSTTATPAPAWRDVWRRGIAPGISDAGLRALRGALERDEPTLLQGVTCSPLGVMYWRDRPVEAACALGYCGWQGDYLRTVGEIEDYFVALCGGADERLGRLGLPGVRTFVDWFDSVPRDEMRRLLLAEVDATLKERGEVKA